MKIGDAEYTAQKNRKKWIRFALQAGFLLLLLGVGTRGWFERPIYTTPSAPIAGDNGFVAISYLGVNRTEGRGRISSEQLKEHLQALHAAGFVAIAPKDIQDYYQKGKLLPERSLFLMFEDARKDTAIFSHESLAALNYKATLFGYAEKIDKQDDRFLSSEDLKRLEESSFWEMGVSGYRLAYINIYDKNGFYRGEMEYPEFMKKRQEIGLAYNHYLMDYLRDKDGIPKEDYNSMKERISRDYRSMRETYREKLGYVPDAYALMHANTGRFGTNDQVSAVNDQWIHTLFKMNFNREGLCLNQKNRSAYDLTRMEPQPHWFVNHLLMRVHDETKKEISFVAGDERRYKAWEVLQGALEIKDEAAVLTSSSYSKGLARLKNSDDFEDGSVNVTLQGNFMGLQRFYLRANAAMQQYVSVYILNNVLYVTERIAGKEKELLRRELSWKNPSSGGSLVARIGGFFGLAQGFSTALGEVTDRTPSKHQLEFVLENTKLRITVDGNPEESVSLSSAQGGSILLESAWGDYGAKEPTLRDPVYDGVFEQIVIKNAKGKGEVFYDGRLYGLDGARFWLKKEGAALMRLFI